MDFWIDCPDDVLITIFKNFDLKTRLEAGRTCRRWYELLKDPCTNMDDVYTIDSWLGNNIFVLLSNIRKAENLRLMVTRDLTVLQRISTMIDDGRLKIDNLTLVSCGDLTMAEYVDAISPSSINGLELSANNNQLILDFDWFRLPRLQRLILHSFIIDPPSTSLPLLKYLDWSHVVFGAVDDEAKARALEAFIRILARFTTLEELKFGNRTRFFDASVRNLLLTINNDLPNLRRLSFEGVDFHLSNVQSITNEFRGSLGSSNLKEIRFMFCDGEWIRAVELFLHVYSLNIIYIRSCFGTEELEEIYRLTPLMKRMRIKFEFEWLINYNRMNNFEDLVLPTELYSILTKMYIGGSSEVWPRLFDFDSFEQLTELSLNDKIDVFNRELLKIILHSCPYLKKLRIAGVHRIIEDDLKLFFDYWDMRRSKQLSVEFLKSTTSIDSLFGTSFDRDRGILENGKRWKIYRKVIFLRNDRPTMRGTRLVIWDQGDSVDDNEPKILIIKDYERNQLNKQLALIRGLGY